MGLTNGWGDDIDEELQNKKKLKVGFMWNFISTNNMITRFDQEVGEVDDKYPKSEIAKMFFSTLTIMVIFELLMYNALSVLALPFFFLYGMILWKIAKLFKRFGYKTMSYWLIAIVAVAAGAGLNYVIWYILPGLH
ncbi:MAG: hypothetical protein IKS85_08965 [Lachnospiraceae bacterium]|nr:hypothetical protein [Lachnospiraceae bacterium]